LSGFIAEPGNPLSRMTAASLGNLGYQVDLDAAEPYVLPNLLTLAEAGALVAHVAPIDVGIAPPVIPMTRPPRWARFPPMAESATGAVRQAASWSDRRRRGRVV
jgi:hypothetical protein